LSKTKRKDMNKQQGTFGVYFMKGAFFLRVTVSGDNLIAQPIHSKGCNKVATIGGTYQDLEHLLESPSGEEAKKLIEILDFDFMIMGHGASVSYYIHTSDGLQKCDLTLYEELL
jgi:hypothetical protein